ncbi:MAG: hypothetical protein RR053_04350 [Evtepia sp.]
MHTYLDAFILDSFRDDTVSRELRLSDDDLTALRLLYPKIRFSKTDSGRLDQSWYLVSFGV